MGQKKKGKQIPMQIEEKGLLDSILIFQNHTWKATRWTKQDVDVCEFQLEEMGWISTSYSIPLMERKALLGMKFLLSQLWQIIIEYLIYPEEHKFVSFSIPPSLIGKFCCLKLGVSLCELLKEEVVCFSLSCDDGMQILRVLSSSDTSHAWIISPKTRTIALSFSCFTFIYVQKIFISLVEYGMKKEEGVF